MVAIGLSNLSESVTCQKKQTQPGSFPLVVHDQGSWRLFRTNNIVGLVVHCGWALAYIQTTPSCIHHCLASISFFCVAMFVVESSMQQVHLVNVDRIWKQRTEICSLCSNWTNFNKSQEISLFTSLKDIWFVCIVMGWGWGAGEKKIT